MRPHSNNLTLLKPLYSQSSRKNETLSNSISPLLGITASGIKQVSSRFQQSVAVNKTKKLRVSFNFKHDPYMFSSELSGWPKVSVMMTATYVMIVSYTDDSRKCNQVLFSLRDLKTSRRTLHVVRYRTGN